MTDDRRFDRNEFGDGTPEYPDSDLEGLRESMRRYGFGELVLDGATGCPVRACEGKVEPGVAGALWACTSGHSSQKIFDSIWSEMDVDSADIMERLGVEAPQIDLSVPLREPSAAPRAPFPTLAWSDIEAPTQSDYLVKGILYRGAFGPLFGAWGTTKTFLALDLVAHIAAGQPWMGRRVQQGAVAYVVSEGRSGITKRAAVLKREKFGDIPLTLIPTTIRLLERGHVETLIEQIRSELADLRLIVFDTLAYAISGGSENDPRDMGRLIAACREIQQRTDNLAILLVHHSGHSSTDRGRGHSSLDAAGDTILQVSEVAGALGTYRMEVKKAKDEALSDPIFYRLEPVDLGIDQDGDPITSCIVEPLGASDRPAPARKLRTKSVDATLLNSVMIEQRDRLGRAAPRDLIDTLSRGGREKDAGALSAGQLVFEIESLREPFYDRAGHDRDTPRDTLKKKFQRARDYLQQAGEIDVSGKWLWFTDGRR